MMSSGDDPECDLNQFGLNELVTRNNHWLYFDMIQNKWADSVPAYLSMCVFLIVYKNIYTNISPKHWFDINTDFTALAVAEPSHRVHVGLCSLRHQIKLKPRGWISSVIQMNRTLLPFNDSTVQATSIFSTMADSEWHPAETHGDISYKTRCLSRRLGWLKHFLLECPSFWVMTLKPSTKLLYFIGYKWQLLKIL